MEDRSQLGPALNRFGPSYDVVVAGGGNAGLCAALVAAEAGCSVLLIEKASEGFRSGNTRHTRNVRDAHDAADGFVTGPYSEEEFFADLVSVTGPELDETLAKLVIAESKTLAGWMYQRGVAWQVAFRGTLGLARTNHFFLGGGKALANAYFRRLAALGARIVYEATALDAVVESGSCTGVAVALADGSRHTVGCRAFVVASGGFEANLDWLAEYWGDRARRFIVRGTRLNEGELLRAMLDRGAQPVGDPKGAHAIAVDARAPAFDGGIVTRLDTVPLGIVVNRDGRRFYDEGEDIWPKRYAIWGTLIAEQPDQIAYSIVDGDGLERIVAPLYPPIEAGSVAELAEALAIDPPTLEQTVREFNAAVVPGTYDLQTLDDCRTAGITPAKSHWARAIQGPPFFAFPLRTGITFTYLGLKVDTDARVQWSRDGVDNIYAAGEVVAGNVLPRGYLAGFGLTIGSTFGRLAGRSAIAHAH